MYMFTGEEIAIMDVYLNNIKKLFNNNYFVCDNVSSVISKLGNPSLFDSRPKLYIIRDDKNFTSSEDIWDSIISGELQKNNSVVFIYQSIDKRGRFYKKFSDELVSFDFLSTDLLCRYIHKDLDLTDEQCRTLVELCENNYSRILLEIDKIKHLCSQTGLTHSKAFINCLDNNVFNIPATGQVFDLLDSILNRDVRESFMLLDMSKRREDNPLSVLSLLFTNVKAILQVQLLGNISGITELTGLTSFQVKLAKEKVNIFSDDELVRFLKVIKYCISGVKNGLLDNDTVLEYMIVNVI